MRPVVLLALALFACKPGGGGTVPGPTTGTPTGTPGGTPSGGTVTEPEVVSASCALDAIHPLKVWCDVELTSAGVATLALSGSGVPGHDYATDEPALAHRILGWGLKPSTEYTWSIGDFSGTVTTGALPSAFSGLDVTVTGSITAGFDAVLIPLNCGGQGFAMLDEDGDIVWFIQNELYTNPMNGYEWSQDTRSLLVSAGNYAIDLHVSGDKLHEWSDFGGRAHHDLARWNGYTYVLWDYSHSPTGLQVDAINVYDGDVLVDTFRLADHFPVTAVPGGFPGDWSHGNGINPTPDGHLIFSMLNFDSVLSVDMDPASPSFLEIDWIAAGTDLDPLGADYVAARGSSEGFEGQHNASFHEGKLYLFDNTGVGGGSRAARYRLDDTTGEVVFEEGWEVGTMCPVQSGAVPMDGHVLATCALNRGVKLFAEGQVAPVFTLDAMCGGGGPFGEAMNRGIPVIIE